MGVIVMLDMVQLMCPAFAAKIKNEVLDNLDTFDMKIHFFAVFMYF